MLLPVVACCVVVSVVGSGFVVVFKGMRKAAQRPPDGFPKGENLHQMCKGRIILFWLSVRGKPCVPPSADHAVPVPTLHYKTHSRHALPISGQLDIFAAGSFCVAGNRQQLRCILVSYTSNK